MMTPVVCLLLVCFTASAKGWLQGRMQIPSVLKGKQAANALLSTSLLINSGLNVPALAVEGGSTTSKLEAAIVSLESATTRGDTVQSMADVFEAAETKTLLVRTKYKYRIINAINEKHVMLRNEWDPPLSYESGELKRRVDPYRTVDLKGYLQVAPFIGAAGYLAALFVQQNLPELFIFAYPGAVFAFVAPAIFIILTT